FPYPTPFRSQLFARADKEEEHLQPREVGQGLERFRVLVTRPQLSYRKPRDGLHRALRPRPAISVGVGASQHPAWLFAAAFPQLAAASPESHVLCPGPGVTDPTPVAGRVNSTRRAPSKSPRSSATTDRTCS